MATELLLAIHRRACCRDQIRTYTQHLRVSHADVDFLGELKVSALLGALEQTAVEASAEGGYDPARYTREGRVWLVRRTRLERLLPTGGGDGLEISTEIADFRRARSLRLYQVRRTGGYLDGPNEPIATASTDWVYCDIESGKPVSVPDEMKIALFGTTDAPTETRARRVPIPESPPDGVSRIAVQPSHLDHMRHVNNAIWADFLENATLEAFAAHGRALPDMLEQGGALRPVEIDLEYLEDARLGDSLEVATWLDEPPSRDSRRAVVTQSVTGPGGRRHLRALSRWGWRARPEILGGIPES